MCKNEPNIAINLQQMSPYNLFCIPIKDIAKQTHLKDSFSILINCPSGCSLHHFYHNKVIEFLDFNTHFLDRKF